MGHKPPVGLLPVNSQPLSGTEAPVLLPGLSLDGGPASNGSAMTHAWPGVPSLRPIQLRSKPQSKAPRRRGAAPVTEQGWKMGLACPSPPLGDTALQPETTGPAASTGRRRGAGAGRRWPRAQRQKGQAGPPACAPVPQRGSHFLPAPRARPCLPGHFLAPKGTCVASVDFTVTPHSGTEGRVSGRHVPNRHDSCRGGTWQGRAHGPGAWMTTAWDTLRESHLQISVPRPSGVGWGGAVKTGGTVGPAAAPAQQCLHRPATRCRVSV